MIHTCRRNWKLYNGSLSRNTDLALQVL